MNKEDKRKKVFVQVLIGLLITAGMIAIFKSGFETGSWLYRLTHK